jgi:hypothetical protein
MTDGLAEGLARQVQPPGPPVEPAPVVVAERAGERPARLPVRRGLIDGNWGPLRICSGQRMVDRVVHERGDEDLPVNPVEPQLARRQTEQAQRTVQDFSRVARARLLSPPLVGVDFAFASVLRDEARQICIDRAGEVEVAGSNGVADGTVGQSLMSVVRWA